MIYVYLIHISRQSRVFSVFYTPNYLLTQKISGTWKNNSVNDLLVVIQICIQQ